jgi:hypothetical protein
VRSWLPRIGKARIHCENGFNKKGSDLLAASNRRIPAVDTAIVTALAKRIQSLKQLSSGTTPERSVRCEYFVELFRNAHMACGMGVSRAAFSVSSGVQQMFAIVV